MSNQHLESAISALSAQVDQQGAKIAELQKQLTDLQASMSCDLSAASASIFQVKAAIEANEQAFAKAVKDVLVKDLAINGTLRKLLI